MELLERIPRQMRTLYREMMAQRVMDKHITDELFHFKHAIGQLTRSRSGSLLLFHFVNKNCDCWKPLNICPYHRELNTIREHDHRTTFQAEKAYHELAKAVKESEMNAKWVSDYVDGNVNHCRIRDGGTEFLSDEWDNVIWKTFRNLCNLCKSNKQWTLEDQ